MARLCLALLRKICGCFKVVKKSVRNFDTESYYNGQLRLSVFYLLALASTAHIIGGCADNIEFIARSLVCAIMYPRELRLRLTFESSRCDASYSILVMIC